MPRRVSTAIWLPLIGRLRRQLYSRESQPENGSNLYDMSIYPSRNKHASSVEVQPRSTPIHNLDDDSLLNIFSLCRPIFFDNHEYGNIEWNWGHEHWWYKLVKVCRRWRYLIISSALHLRFYLLCTLGTPVADMLAYSPPFPLFINLNTEIYHPTAEDEEGILLALQHRDRVRRIRLQVPIHRFA